MSDETSDVDLPPLEREQAWHALVLRMAQSSRAPVTPQPKEMEVFAGEIAPNLPVTIPLPSGSRVVGTVLNARGMEETTVYIDALGSPRDVVDFYRRRLISDGWYEMDIGERTSNGFNDTDHSYQIHGQFCRSEQGPALFLEATQQDKGLVAARIGVYMDRDTSPCAPREQRGLPDDPVPPLPLPPGGRIVMGAGPSGSRGPHNSHFGVEIAIERDLAAVVEHYGGHLQYGGWTQRESGGSELSVWSTWAFQHARGDAWSGLLLVFKRPDFAHRYVLQIWTHVLREE